MLSLQLQLGIFFTEIYKASKKLFRMEWNITRVSSYKASLFSCQAQVLRSTKRKFRLPIIETGSARISKLQEAQTAPNTFPTVVLGAMSPYPTVVIVTMAHQKDSGIVLNFVLLTCSYKEIE